jgi:superfamily II DNA or RNA helicase
VNLRPYQAQLKAEVRAAWSAGARNVLMRLDTGGGKTIILSDLIQEHPGASAVIAHRQELVSQLSLALARAGVVHNIVAAKKTITAITQLHLAEFGRSFYNPGARCAVASVDTLIRATGLEHWFQQVTLWIVDEGHHVVADNKWASVVAKFTHPQCLGLLPTATPQRADGKGLGAHADGVAHVMVQGPPMRWLIEQGYLTDYRMVCVESDLVEMLNEASVGASGDYSTATLRNASKASHIVGDMVKEYRRWAPGRLAIVFTSDTETAADTTAAYRAAGIRAETLTGKTDDGLRRQMLAQFARRGIDVLVVVDIVSEGFDLPAVEVGVFGRKTESLATYMQQFGRALRPMYAPGFDLSTQAGRLAAIAASPKPRAIIIDHVNNFLRHGPPDRPRPWTLDGKGRGGGGDGIPMRICALTPPRQGCYQPYERFHHQCPYCGEAPDPVEPTARGSPAKVDGDLTELDVATLDALRGAVAEVDQSADDYSVSLLLRNVPRIGMNRLINLHAERQAAQASLRWAMAQWGGLRKAEGLDDRQMQRLWFHTFGLDVMSAAALGTAEAQALTERVCAANGDLRAT